MRRRDVMIVLAGVMVAWPLAARAQQKPVPVIGVLSTGSSTSSGPVVGAFRQGLAEAGYVEGRNVLIEYRWAEGNYDRLPALAADLVDRHVSVIVPTGGAPATVAAHAATSTIPIVFNMTADPLKL